MCVDKLTIYKMSKEVDTEVKYSSSRWNWFMKVPTIEITGNFLQVSES